MTKEAKIVGGVALGLLVALIGVCFATADGAVETAAEHSPEAAADGAAEAAAVGELYSDERYLVREEDGAVAVYLCDTDERIMELDISVAKLRSADRALLCNGIVVEGEEALWRVIEDFSS